MKLNLSNLFFIMSTNVVLINDKTANNQLPPFIVVKTKESQTIADLEAFLTRKYGETVEIFLDVGQDNYAPKNTTVAQLKHLRNLPKYPTFNFAPVVVRRQSPGPLIRPNSPNSSSGSNAYRPNSPSQSRPDTRPNSQISSPRSNSPRSNSPRSNSPRPSAASSSSIQEIELDDELAEYLAARFPEFFVLRQREQTYREMFTSGAKTDKFMGLTEFDPKTVTLGSIGNYSLTQSVFKLKHRVNTTNPSDVMNKVPPSYYKLKPASDFDDNDVTYREYFQTILESKMKDMAEGGKLVPLHQTDERGLIKDIQPRASDLMSKLDADVRPYVMIAGGSIVNNIVSREYKTPLSDVDIFLVGTRSDEHAEEVTRKMLLYIMGQAKIIKNKYGALIPQFSVSRSKFAINVKIETENIVGSNRKTRYEYQIILRRYLTPSEVLHGFDLDASGVGYYEDKYYATDRALYSLSTMTLYIDLKRLSESYNYRLAKYAAQKGFTIASPINFPLEVLQAAFDVKIVPKRRTVLDREKLYNSDMNSTLEGLVIFFRFLNRSSGLHKKNLNISDYNANKVGSGLNDEHGVTIYRDAEDQIVSYAISSKRLGYLSAVRSGDNPGDMTSSIKNDAINLIINGGNALLGNSKVSQHVSFISQDPGRQFTGSFNPLKYNLTHWNGIINPTPKLFKRQRKSSRPVELSSKPSSSSSYNSLARRTAAINREDTSQPIEQIGFGKQSDYQSPSSSVYRPDPYSTVKSPLEFRGRSLGDNTPRSSASSLSPRGRLSDSGQLSSRSSSIGRTPFRYSSGELSPVTKSPPRN